MAYSCHPHGESYCNCKLTRSRWGGSGHRRVDNLRQTTAYWQLSAQKDSVGHGRARDEHLEGLT